jgi:hypothetical protein
VCLPFEFEHEGDPEGRVGGAPGSFLMLRLHSWHSSATDWNRSAGSLSQALVAISKRRSLPRKSARSGGPWRSQPSRTSHRGLGHWGRRRRPARCRAPIAGRSPGRLESSCDGRSVGSTGVTPRRGSGPPSPATRSLRHPSRPSPRTIRRPSRCRRWSCVSRPCPRTGARSGDGRRELRHGNVDAIGPVRDHPLMMAVGFPTTTSSDLPNHVRPARRRLLKYRRATPGTTVPTTARTRRCSERESRR